MNNNFIISSILHANRSVQNQRELYNFNDFIALPGKNIKYRRCLNEYLDTDSLVAKASEEKMRLNQIPPDDRFIAKLAESFGLEYAYGQIGADRYYAKNGAPIYPPNDGRIGIAENVTVESGTILSRYGYYKGKFFANETDSFEQRALPRTTNQNKYHRYRVKKPLLAKKAKIAPWFGEPGGGIQYKISDDIFNKFDDYFEEI